MKERQKTTQILSGKYQKSRKKDKSRILDEYIELTKYNRSYASYLLNNWGKRIKINTSEESLVFILGKRKRKNRAKVESEYAEIIKPLKKIWLISGLLCGKLLKEYIMENLRLLEGFKEIRISIRQRKKLLKVSASTIDRMLSPEKKELELKARKGTKPGTLLKHKIPIRTYSEWNEKRPGFFEMDLVSHDGGDASGEFIHTLDATDVCTGWTETEAVLNKAQVYVFRGIENIRTRLKYKLLGLDNDNGSEFINHQMYRYCKEHKLTFTRSRPLRKNDNCYVEQKNYSIVRKTVGYYRYEGIETVRMMNRLYTVLRLITNYFTPVMKIASKERIGSKVRKTYDKPRTPYQRALESKYISRKEKSSLRQEKESLNPAELRRELLRLQKKLFSKKKRVCRYRTSEYEFAKEKDNYVYIR